MIEQPVPGIMERTIANGGGTFDSRTRLPFTPSHGFAVGVCEGTAAKLVDVFGIEEAVKRIAEEFLTPYVGTWVEPDGSIDIDPVRWIADPLGDDALAFRTAVQLGRAFGQKAIYGFAKKEVITL